jgi:hypothetical protein
VGVDLNFRIQGWRAGAKSELVPEGEQQDNGATTCRKKVIAPSSDIGFQSWRSQIKATRISYMMVGVHLNLWIQLLRGGVKSELVPEGGQQDNRATTCGKKVIAPSSDIGFQCSRPQIKGTRVRYMMVGVDLNLWIQLLRGGVKSELVPEGGQQDSWATACRKKVIARSSDIGFQCPRSQIQARSVSYMMVGVDLNFWIQGWRAGAKRELVREGG